MKFLYVGVILGVFLGVGLTALYLALSEREILNADEAWIDEVIERAFDAVNDSLERV
jgi:hypothetical protein